MNHAADSYPSQDCRRIRLASRASASASTATIEISCLPDVLPRLLTAFGEPWQLVQNDPETDARLMVDTLPPENAPESGWVWLHFVSPAASEPLNFAASTHDVDVVVAALRSRNWRLEEWHPV